jgi:hypothetical protein
MPSNTNNNLDQQNILKNIMPVAPKHCDNCGAKYSEGDFRIMKSTNTSVILHLRCRTCNNVYMLNIMNPINGMIGAQRIPLNIDLVDEEINKYAGKNAVSEDDALDLFDQIHSNIDQEALRRLLC